MSPSRSLNRFATFVASLCFVLLLVGGLVHNTRSGLACGTDWPRCAGQWMPKMEGNVLVEHGHRLLASAVGLFTLVLAVWIGLGARRQDGRAGQWLAISAIGFVVTQLAGLFVFMGRGDRAVPPPGYATVLFYSLAVVGAVTLAVAITSAFRDETQAIARRANTAPLGLALTGVGLVVAQGLLGALTVQLGLSAALSTAHLGTSMLFFMVLLAIAFRTRPGPSAHEAPRPALPAPVRYFVYATILVVYAQMLLGAAMRHLGAGMICGDEFPLCHGTVWPAGAHYAVYLHILHRAFAFAVLGVSIYAAAAVRRASTDGRVRALATALPALVVLQIGLGVLSVWSFLGVAQVTSHLAVAALLLADLVALSQLGRPLAAVADASPERGSDAR